MKRLAALVSGAILAGAFLVLGGAPAAGSAEFTVTGTIGGQVYSTGRDLTVEMGPSAACFVDELWLMDEVRIGGKISYEPSKRVQKNGIPVPLATNEDTGKIIPLPNIPAGKEIIFGILSNAGTNPIPHSCSGPLATVTHRGIASRAIFVTGDMSRNPDWFPHAKVSVAGDGTATIGFEDVDRTSEVDQNSPSTNGPCANHPGSIPWTIARTYIKDPDHDAPFTSATPPPAPPAGYYRPEYAGGYYDNFVYAENDFANLKASAIASANSRPAWCPDWNDMTFTLRGRQGGGGGGGGTSTTDCTFTIGYWKNHAGFGPQANALSPLLPVTLGTSGGADSKTVTTASQAVTYLGYSGTSSNGIDKLYGQLLAAKLNIRSGADPTAVSATIASSDSFLATHLDASWASIGGAQQAIVLGWVSVLDQYNNGLIGPGHCQ